MSVSDLTNTKWVFNETFYITDDIGYEGSYKTYSLSFNSNSQSFNTISFGYDFARVLYDYNTVAEEYNTSEIYRSSFTNVNYATIEITGGNDATNSTLISWLEANATLQESGGGDTSSATNKIGNLEIIKKHFGDLEIIKEVLNGSTIYESAKTYTITSTITNGSYTGDSTITNTASVTISANSGYSLPSTISVTGATYTYDSSTGVVSLSNPTGNVTISATCIIKQYPTKSKIILIDLDGNGAKRYLVLKNVSGTTYEILWMPSSNADNFGSAKFATSGNRYNGGGVDNALNTFYNSLTQTAKSAIVDKTFNSGYYYNAVESLTRHIYAITPSDISTYLGTTPNGLTTKNMLWGNFTPYDNKMWTRAGNQTVSGQATMILLGNSTSEGYYSERYSVTTTAPIRPAMQIDLSKINFTIEA